MNKKLRVFLLAVLAVVFITSVTSADALTFNWTGKAGDGKWESPKNWSLSDPTELEGKMVDDKSVVSEVSDSETEISTTDAYNIISADIGFYPGGNHNVFKSSDPSDYDTFVANFKSGTVEATIAKNFSSIGTLSVNAGTTEEVEVTLIVNGNRKMLFSDINVSGNGDNLAKLTFDGDKGTIGNDTVNVNVNGKGVLKIGPDLQQATISVTEDAVLSLGGTFAAGSSFEEVAGELILTNPAAQLALKADDEETGITFGEGGTLTLGAEDSEAITVALASLDNHVTVTFTDGNTLNVPVDVSIDANAAAFFTAAGSLNVTGNGTLTLNAGKVAKSSDRYAPIISEVTTLNLTGVNLVLVGAPSAARGDGGDNFPYKYVIGEGLTSIYLTADSDGNPATLTAGTRTLTNDGESPIELSLSGKAENAATIAENAADGWTINVGSQATVTLSGDQTVSGLTGEGTVTAEQADGEYLTLNGESSGFTDFAGTLTATNVLFGGDLSEYPFGSNENIAIEKLNIINNLNVAGTLDNVTIYLRAQDAEDSAKISTASADNSEKIGNIGSLHATADATVGGLFVDAGFDSIIAKISAVDGATLAINEATFYNNVEATKTPYEGLKAVEIGINTEDESQSGTVVINSASGGKLTDDEEDGVAEDAISVKGGTLKIAGDVGDSNITVAGGTLEVANGVTLLGSLTFEENSEAEVVNKFVTEITSAQKTSGKNKGQYAVMTQGALTINGNLSVDVTHDSIVFNGYVKGDEYRVLGTNGEFEPGDVAAATDEFAASVVEADSEGNETPGVILKVNKDFVTPELGQASIDGPSGWNKLERWAANQFWVTVPVVSIDPVYYTSKDGDQAYYLKVHAAATDKKKVTEITNETFANGVLSFRGVFSDLPEDAATGEAFTIQIGLSWDRNPETTSVAVAGKLSADSFVNVSYDIVFLNDVLGSSDIIEALGGVSENSTAEVEPASDPEITPDAEEVKFTVKGLTASVLTTTSTAMELVDGKYQPKDKALDPTVVYSLPTADGVRTFDEVEVLVNGSPVASEDASVDVGKSPAEVTVKFSALGYTGGIREEKRLALRGKKSFNRETITTEAVTFWIVSTDISYEDVSGDVKTAAIVSESGDVEYIGVLGAEVLPDGSEFGNQITFVTPLPEWLEYSVTSDSVTIQAKEGVTTETASQDVPVKFAVQVVDADGNVSYKGYRWLIKVGAGTATEYALVASGDVDAKVQVNAIANYSLVVRVEPAPAAGATVTFGNGTLPSWLEKTENGSTVEFAAVEGATDEVGATYEFEVFASVDSKALAPVTVKIEVVSGDGPVPPAPGRFEISTVTGSLTPTVSVGKAYELSLRADRADHWMVGDSEEAPAWLNFKENGETANFSIEATEEQLADSPYTFVVHAYAGERETSADLVITVVSGEVSPDVPGPNSPDVPPALGITGITGTKSATANATTGAFTFTLGTSGTPAGTVVWTATGTGDNVNGIVNITSTANGVITGTVDPTLIEAYYTITVVASDDVNRVTDELSLTYTPENVTPTPSGDVTPTYTLTGFTSSNDVAVFAGARFSIPVTITGTAPTPAWTATVSGDAFTVTPTSGSGKSFTLTGTAPTAAGTYQITLRATYSNLTPITKTVNLVVTRRRVGGGSSGGCDAGFGALALLLATPLFLRKRK